MLRGYNAIVEHYSNELHVKSKKFDIKWKATSVNVSIKYIDTMTIILDSVRLEIIIVTMATGRGISVIALLVVKNDQSIDGKQVRVYVFT